MANQFAKQRQSTHPIWDFVARGSMLGVTWRRCLWKTCVLSAGGVLAGVERAISCKHRKYRGFRMIREGWMQDRLFLWLFIRTPMGWDAKRVTRNILRLPLVQECARYFDVALSRKHRVAPLPKATKAGSCGLTFSWTSWIRCIFRFLQAHLYFFFLWSPVGEGLECWTLMCNTPKPKPLLERILD